MKTLFRGRRQNQKVGHSRPLFLYFRLFYCLIKFRRCLDLNRRSLVSEVNALPAEPQPLPLERVNICNLMLKNLFDNESDTGAYLVEQHSPYKKVLSLNPVGSKSSINLFYLLKLS